MSLNPAITRILLPGMLCGLVLLAGCAPDGGAGRPEMPPPDVTVMEVQPQNLPLSVELPGRTSAHLVADVRPQVSGIIQKRFFEEGALVASGTPLYRIDPASYQADRASAKASLAKAEAALTTARLKAERYRNLLKSNSVSQQEADEMDALEKQAAAEVMVNRALLNRAEIDLERTTIRSPIRGRIGRSSVTVGALVSANQPSALATVQQLDPMYVDITRPTSEILQLRKELANGSLQRSKANKPNVTLLLEDGSAYPHPGHLAFSDITVDPGTASVTLRAVFPNPDGLLLPGMYVRAILQEGEQKNAIAVPQQAVIRNPQGQASVMVVDAENTATPKPVVLGRLQGQTWLVEEGLQPGERVITEGLIKVRPGSKVSPKAEKQ